MGLIALIFHIIKKSVIFGVRNMVTYKSQVFDTAKDFKLRFGAVIKGCGPENFVVDFPGGIVFTA